MNRMILFVVLAAFALPITGNAQIVDEFKPPTGTCCLPAAAQKLADQLQDWNQLARYHDDNEKMKQQPADPKRVVFLGDSITDTWKLSQSFPTSRTSIAASADRPLRRCWSVCFPMSST